MQCSSCAVKRCSSEFPAALSEKCEHPPSFCLSCLLCGGAASGLPEKCPEPGCCMSLTAMDLQRLKAAIHHCDRECAAFKDLDTLKEREAQAKVEATLGYTGPESGELEVTVLDGRRCKLTINRQMHLSDVKKLIEEKLRVPSGQQRLLFRKRDLGTVENPDPRWGTLGVPFGEALQLIVIMYETGPASSSAVRSLTFDLSWTAAPTRLRNGKVTTHHLNGSCLIFTATGGHVGTVDFQRRPVLGISHGGPSSLRSPNQTLQVDTRVLPPDVKYLFFTLSGFAPGGVTMAVFQNPSVHLRDAATRTTLSSYTANQRNSEAVVLCYASRDPYGQWRVSQVGVSSSGNKSDYSPLVHTIQDLVHSGRAV